VHFAGECSVKLAASGCLFFNRCLIAIEGTCNVQFPPAIDCGQNHFIACHNKLAMQ
jgi:ABC-type dipeptide/oligopeptide/nickel transport system ATPase component